jgi:hypothetical protein
MVLLMVMMMLMKPRLIDAGMLRLVAVISNASNAT